MLKVYDFSPFLGIGGTAGSPRRDSFDRRDATSLGTMAGTGFSGGLDSQLSRQMTQQKGNQFYGPLGSVTASGPGPIGMIPPSQSLTPPPSLNGGSLGNLNLGEYYDIQTFSSYRFYCAEVLFIF